MTLVLKNIIKLLIPEFIRKSIREEIYFYKIRDRKVKLGNDNKDKTFLVIRDDNRFSGIGSILSLVITNIIYARKLGYIPVVDLLNVESQYHDKVKVGVENAWEYYFLQPSNYNLQDISNSKNVIISIGESGNKKIINKRNIANKIYLFDKENINVILEYKKYYKEYIKFIPEIKEKFENDYIKILKNKGRVLGVIGRGTDFISKKPKNHRVIPEPSVLLNKVIEIYKQEKFDYIYLATEDNDIFKLFKDEFSDKMLDNEQKRISQSDIENHYRLSDAEFDYGERQKYKLGIDYLSSINLLSKCSGICGGVTSATAIAYIMSNGYEFEYFFDLGIY